MPEQADSPGASLIKNDKSEPVNQQLIFYPAYCYSASPTWFTWVKLTASAIHTQLHERKEFRTAPSYVTTENGWLQNHTLLLFYLNHPIQFVQLTGVVVTFEEYYEKVWLFTLDDSSGATIDVVCRKPLKDNGGEELHPGAMEQEEHKEAEVRYACMALLEIGMIVQVKGMITVFRDTRQLQLERISFLGDTNQEMRIVAARTVFFQQVLSQPWQVPLSEQQSLRAQALGESRTKSSKQYRLGRMLQAREKREKRHAEKILRTYQREEVRRLVGASEAREAARNPPSHVVKTRA